MLKLKLQYFGYLMQTAKSLEKTLMLGKIEVRRRRGMTEDEMVGWHHRLYGHEFEQAMGDGEGQGSQVCCSSQCCKKLDMTEQLNNNSNMSIELVMPSYNIILCHPLLLLPSIFPNIRVFSNVSDCPIR